MRRDFCNPLRIMKTTTLQLTNSMNQSHTRLAFLLILAVCFALLPQARAVCQQGCDLANSNTFLGDDALLNNTTGFANTAVGASALFSNTTGEHNTANGINALFNNTTGSDNTGIGLGALQNKTTALTNTASGSGALASNTTGSANTTQGMDALFANTTGLLNTAAGSLALVNNTTGSSNTATGADTLLSNRIGSNNTAIGSNALARVNSSSNIAVGSNAGANLVTGSNNIYIGNEGISSDEHAKIRIGTTGTQRATFIAGISGVTVPAGVGVIVGTDGKLGTVVSSARFKDEIKPMNKASEAILALKPVTFRYKEEFDPEGIPQFGLLAEQVAKVNPDLVARDDDGRPYGVRYEAVNAMLLNEFLKEHRKVTQQGNEIAELKATVA